MKEKAQFNKEAEEKVATATPETANQEDEIVLLKSYQKTIRIENDKLFENDSEVVYRTVDADGAVQTVAEPDKISQGDKLARSYYQKLISRPFENVIVLTGAGTSKTSGGKVMTELWEQSFPSANSIENEKFFKLINFPIPTKDDQKNLEELLSQAQKAIEVLGDTESKEVRVKIEGIEKMIVDACTLTIQDDSPHLKFLNKLTSRKLKYSRIKVFTLNYDTLFEQAAADGSFITINGFSFSNPSYFHGSFFDYDIVNRKDSRVNQDENFVTKVFHLYKPHGSVNWKKIEDGKIVSNSIASATDKPLIIYPNSNKYESGYDQPFFEMMSRFQHAMRQPNTLLLCIGFSFGDKHFRNVIKEAIKSNPGLNLLVAMPNFMDKPSVDEFVKLAEKQNNVTFINESFQDFAEHYPFSQEYDHDERD